MKKVLVLAAAAMLLAAPAMAVVQGTAHDLSSTSGNSIKGGSDRICVYCHTPHGASAASTAPLWNRTTVNAVTVYGNPTNTMDVTVNIADVNASDAILCLSCHDGSSLTGALTNPPNSGGNPLTGLANIAGASKANLGTDLSDDHPIGFVYATSAGADSEIRATPLNSLKVDYAGDKMWCSSCHDVHNNTNGEFLVMSNADSALCTSCHIK